MQTKMLSEPGKCLTRYSSQSRGHRVRRKWMTFETKTWQTNIVVFCGQPAWECTCSLFSRVFCVTSLFSEANSSETFFHLLSASPKHDVVSCGTQTAGLHSWYNLYIKGVVYFIKTQVNNLFYKPVFSVNHLGDANEASAGVWTSMAFSSPAQTTVEETFSVKTSKTATTASENGADHPRRPQPLHPFVLTMWPRARVFSLIHTFYALQAVHSKIEEKKRGEKNPDTVDKRDNCKFSLLFSVVDQVLTS